MKGQRLFVRTATAAEIAEAGARIGLPSPPPAGRFWIAFLVGDPVALAGTTDEQHETNLIFLHVAEPLRRKRIGSVMILEIESALPAGLTRLAVRKDLLPREFLVRCGFVEDASQFTRDLSAGTADAGDSR